MYSSQQSVNLKKLNTFLFAFLRIELLSRYCYCKEQNVNVIKYNQNNQSERTYYYKLTQT